MKLINKLFAVSIGVYSSFVFADASQYKLEPVVVTATRTSQAAEQTIAPTIVITAKEIEQSQASDVTDLLRQHAGIELGRNGGAGQLSSIFIRGAESDHVLLLVDGVKVNSGTISAPTWEDFSPSLIERIEIVKGPRSSLYGSEAIGGVVNIITKRATEGAQWQASAGFGADNTQKYNLSYHIKENSIRMGASGESFSTDGIPPKVAQDFGGGHKSKSVNAYLGYEENGRGIELATWQTTGGTEYVGQDENYNEIPKDQDSKTGTTSLTAKYQTGAWKQTLLLSRVTNELYQNQITRFTDFNTSMVIESNDFAVTKRNTLDWQNDIRLGKSNLLTAGVYFSKEKTASMSYGTAYDEDTSVNAAYLQDNIKAGNHQLIAAGRLTDHEDFGTEGSYNIDYGWSVNRSLKLLVGIGKGYRAPSATERFGSGGNPELNPETSFNTELGLRYTFSKRHYTTVSVFQNKIKNLIEWYDPDGYLGPQDGKLENIGNTRIRGGELSYHYQQRNLSWSLEGIFQNPEDRDKKELLLRRAKRSFTTQLSYTKDSHTYGLEGLYSAYREDIDDFGNRVELPAYGLINLFLTDRLDSNLSLNLKIENLFDRDYQLASGYNTQGLLALLEIKYSSK